MKQSDNIIKVCSFMRSGTHLLMSSLFVNFEFNENLADFIRVPGASWQGSGVDCASVPYAKLFGTHDNFLNCEIDINNIIYIIRDPRYTLYSCWRGLGSSELPKQNISFSEYCTEQRIREWYFHVRSYIENNVFFIKYEDLIRKNTFLTTMKDIEEHFNLKRHEGLTKNYFQYVKQPVGWNPGNIKTLGKYKYFNKDICDYFKSIIPENFLKKIGYPILTNDYKDN